jgi:uncharacterized membrane protein YccC
MSAESATAQNTSATHDLRLVRTVRYAAGTTLAVALAMGIDWQLSYLTPMLALMFLAPPAQRPNPKLLAGFAGIVAVASMAGVAMSATLLMYPVAFLLIEGLILFLLFYRHARGAPPLLTMWLMIAVTVIPVVALQSMDLTLAVARGLVVGAAVAMAVVWLAYVLVPDPVAKEPDASAGASAKEKPAPPSRELCISGAAVNTIVVFPVVALFLYFGLTSVLILVFVALLSMQPDLATGRKAGKALIVGNLMGGVAAILVFELLVMVPEFVFLLLLTLFVGLSFGSRLFSDAPTGPLFGQAFSTMLLVVLSATSAFGEADTKAWTRVLQITTAVVYLVAAHAAVRSLIGKSETSNATT